MSARIAPATRREMGPLNSAITGVLGVAAGTGPPNLFATLARHRRMFRPWLRFAATLMPAGSLPRRDTELVILRVAHLCGCAYEWQHHVRLAREVGFAEVQFDAVRRGPDDGEWTARQALLLRAVDELHADRTLSDETWKQLSSEMLAMTINSLGIEPDQPRPPKGLARAVHAAASQVARRST